MPHIKLTSCDGSSGTVMALAAQPKSWCLTPAIVNPMNFNVPVNNQLFRSCGFMKEERIPAKELSQRDLQHFFISHLNRIYCAKSQLLEKLPELEKRAAFLDLRQAISEMIDLVSLQIKRMKEIYILMDATYRQESCIGLIGILDEAFQSVGALNESAAVSDLSLLFYMQNIESIETASFSMMMLVADKLKQPQILQLLRECFDEAKEDKMLLKEITGAYINP